jgi:translation initiation factor 2 subunit 1
VCYSEEGIELIKKVLINARDKINEKFADQNLKITLKLVSPPHYEITTQSTSKSAGGKILWECLNLIEESSKSNTDIVYKMTKELEILGDAQVEDIETIFTKNLNMEENNSDSNNEDNEEGMAIDETKDDDD